MNIEFFQLTEHAIKLRRNYLFLAVLVYLHTQVANLSGVKLFSIQLQGSFIEHGLVIAITWFGFNYIYYLYAEYTEWKAKHIPVETKNSHKGLESSTLIPQVSKIDDNFRLEVSIGDRTNPEFSIRTVFSNEDTNRFEEISKKQMTEIAQKFEHILKSDIERIREFQGAIDNYNIANRIRFYILDLAIPLYTVSICYYLINTN